MKQTLKYFLTSLVTLLVILPSVVLADENDPAVISVSGIGTLNIAPDMANISFGVTSEAKTAREALNQNNQSMAAAIKALQDAGVEKKDIQTSQFNIQPRYFYPKATNSSESNQPRIIGYSVNNNLAVGVRDIALTGQILDQVVSLGVNSGGNISFTNQDMNAIMRQARERAVKDAIDKANTLANSAGVELGKILSISEGVERPLPVNLVRGRAMAMEAASSEVPIASGEQTYRIDVQMVWEIDQ